MDFVVSRREERTNGWRSRVTEVLEEWGVRVFDPWYKPIVRGLSKYGIEDETSADARKEWRFDDSKEGASIRSRLSGAFWPVMHVDLRMVDLSDFVIACCPTNLYSVGTPHEIVLARQQRKPVLVVSPPVRYSSWEDLKALVADQAGGHTLLQRVASEVVALENEKGTPSQWYMTLVGTESFFDGFGWSKYKKRFGWRDSHLDEREADPNPPVRPLLDFLESLRSGKRPQLWDDQREEYRDNDDWLLLQPRPLRARERTGKALRPAPGSPQRGRTSTKLRTNPEE